MNDCPHGNFVAQWLSGKAQPHVGDRVERAVATMTPEKFAELRQVGINASARVMRDSSDRALRTKAFKVLVQLGVVRQTGLN